MSPWSLSSSTKHGAERADSPLHENRESGPNTPGRGGHKRPMSMLVHSSPQLVPAVTLESPRSPPRGYLQRRNDSRSPDRNSNTLPFGQAPQPTAPSPSWPSTRSGTPSLDTGKRDQSLAKSSVAPPPVSKDQPSSRNRSIPPPVNRAEKPKIPPKPSLRQSVDEPPPPALKPASSQSENRVSPFSTPPSSEGSSSPEDKVIASENDAATSQRPLRPVNRLNTAPNLKGSTVAEEVGDPVVRSNDPRLLGFVRPGRIPQSSEVPSTGTSGRSSPTDTIYRQKAAQPHPTPTSSSRGSPARQSITGSVPGGGPPRLSSEHQRKTTPDFRQDAISAPRLDARNHGFSGPKIPADEEEEDKPGLPPRRTRNEPPPRALNHSKGATLDIKALDTRPVLINRSTKPQRPTILHTGSVAATQAFPPPPKRNTDPQPSPAISEPRQTIGNTNDSDEEDELRGEPLTSRSEYPDASQANRRPPNFGSGAQEIPTKYDSRVFDVCGQFVCTTGYTTRIWDLSAGEQVMSLNHGETVKVLSVIFKPGRRFEEEGNRIWIGNSLGELQEVDILTQTITASSLAHGRREIIRILRHRKDLWTLDDEGKLFLWVADEGGTPNLRYSHQSYRVKKGHSFSMVVQDTLWLAAGKEIHIYRPGSDTAFHVLQRPLLEPRSGEITSGTLEKNSGKVYFGHTDGKVSIYSAKDLVLLSSMKASDYKINSMTFVGDYLWAAYKTGKIYVYDTTVSPWKVKKDWKAHEGPVVSMLLDPSSIWTLNRLQVASLGQDNYVRLWDGMLEDDWTGKVILANGAIQSC